jgi:hypothetical protein
LKENRVPHGIEIYELCACTVGTLSWNFNRMILLLEGMNQSFGLIILDMKTIKEQEFFFVES